MKKLLIVNNLKTYFHVPVGIVKAVDGISYSLNYGEALGIVGESGSGKTVSMLSVLGLLGENAKIEGEALFDNKDLLKLDKESLRKIRGKDISIVFQDPMTSLNPTIKIYEQLIEPLLWHNLTNKEKAKIYALQMLKKVGIPDPQKRLFSYPFQFSGGMKQRIMIAMALICKPKLLIADEPTTALDVTIRAQILNLLQDMRKEFKMSVIMITHDFSIALNFCDRIIVMYAGKIVESAPSSTFIKNPKHPYSLGLLNSTLDIETTEKKLTPIKGMPPDLINPPSGCRFHPRCQYATKKCEKEVPELKEIEKNHFVACHLF